MVVPSDDKIRAQMEEMMKVVDLETMSTKQFISALSAKFGGADLSGRKKFIKAAITEIIDSMAKDAEGDDHEAAVADGDGGSDDKSSDDDDDDDVAEEEVDLKPKKKGSGGGLSAVKEISDELAAFLDSGKHMARTSIVKSLWDYIKKNNLQNPSDKREILLDEKMKAVFGVDTFTVCTGIIRSDLM
jgi:upstream activation factor subunit UAF30